MFYLTGAETERRALEKLLLRRAEFTGQSLDANAKMDAIDHSGWRDANSSEDHSLAPAHGPGTKKAVVIGFGKEMAEVYGLGSRFDERMDGEQENERFQTKVDDHELPAVVKSRGGKQWLGSASDSLKIDPKKLAERAKKANRTKMVYAGMFVGTEKEVKEQGED